MELSEMVTTLQKLLKDHGDLIVLDANDYPIEEISLCVSTYSAHGDHAIKLFSEGDEH